ncbi:MAG: lipid-binding SYLF domain-containing protein [Parvularculaceae bacterium]|nr:lipid-binding SYLF domain-containing protein [Parvularculaceae bacterium]
MVKSFIRAGLAAALGLTIVTAPAAAGDKREEAIELVEESAETIAYFSQDSAFEPLWSLADQAKAMVVIPNSWRAGFIFGGSGGDAVMIARNKDGTWSQPTFFVVGSGSFGFQAGIEKSEIVLLVMTQRGMEHLLSTTVKLGADVSIAAGPIGAGAKAQTTDILAFSRSRGLYGGLTLEGALLKTRKNFNKAYYAAEVSPADVIYKGEVYNPTSAALQNSVWRLANKDAPASLAPAVAPAAQPATSSYPAQPLPADPNAPQKGDYEDDAVWGAPIGKDE